MSSRGEPGPIVLDLGWIERKRALVGYAHLVDLTGQKTGHDQRAVGPGQVGERGGEFDERVSQDIGEHNIERPR